MIDYDRDQIEPEYGEFVSIHEESHDEDELPDHDCQDERSEAAASGEASPQGEARQGECRQRRENAKRQAELPSPLYRLRILHSNETFFAWYDSTGAKPNFRTIEALEEALEGPSRSSVRAEDGQSSDTTLAAAESIDPESPVPAGVQVAPEADPAASSPEAMEWSAESLIPSHSIVVAPTRYGRDLCEVQGIILDTSIVNPDEVALIEKAAGLDELRKLKANQDKEAKAYELCRQKIWSRNLPMKLVSAHYMLDEPKILFYFSAESRVDFRELVKDLVSVFKMRIELRQIGVRDEARVTGGCGVCGRILCCRGVSDKLNPVSIKMAKDQNLSLNSLKISGPCGRLLCCLAYEYQFYRDARRELPPEGARFTYDGTPFRVVEVNPLSGSVKMSGEDGRLLDMAAEHFHFVEGRWRVKE